jgi:hypothetical protein
MSTCGCESDCSDRYDSGACVRVRTVIASPLRCFSIVTMGIIAGLALEGGQS